MTSFIYMRIPLSAHCIYYNAHSNTNEICSYTAMFLCTDGYYNPAHNTWGHIRQYLWTSYYTSYPQFLANQQIRHNHNNLAISVSRLFLIALALCAIVLIVWESDKQGAGYVPLPSAPQVCLSCISLLNGLLFDEMAVKLSNKSSWHRIQIRHDTCTQCPYFPWQPAIKEYNCC